MLGEFRNEWIKLWYGDTPVENQDREIIEEYHTDLLNEVKKQANKIAFTEGVEAYVKLDAILDMLEYNI